MNKGTVVNLLAAALVVFAYILQQPVLLSVGLFALSGAVTNWLAVYMLFERIPGIYGSGVIPAQFEAFKISIRALLMEQFFSVENIQRLLVELEDEQVLDLGPIIDQLDLSPAFDSLLKAVQESSFGSVITMFGGASALQPLKEPFLKKLAEELRRLVASPAFHRLLHQALLDTEQHRGLQFHIERIITARLEELTPEMVKKIVQDIIREHLSWLVVWGGVFGGAMGLVVALLSQYPI